MSVRFSSCFLLSPFFLSILLSDPLFGFADMPLFLNKFAPKRPPPRKSATSSLSTEHLQDESPLSSDGRKVSLTLGSDQRFRFEEGDWIPERGGDSKTYKANQKLRKRCEEMEEENNMLKLRVEILMNMLSKVTAERNLRI